MRISDWSSDVCSSDLCQIQGQCRFPPERMVESFLSALHDPVYPEVLSQYGNYALNVLHDPALAERLWRDRSEEHTSELQSLMRISYAVFCLKKKIKNNTYKTTHRNTSHPNTTC